MSQRLAQRIVTNQRARTRARVPRSAWHPGDTATPWYGHLQLTHETVTYRGIISSPPSTNDLRHASTILNSTQRRRSLKRVISCSDFHRHVTCVTNSQARRAWRRTTLNNHSKSPGKNGRTHCLIHLHRALNLTLALYIVATGGRLYHLETPLVGQTEAVLSNHPVCQALLLVGQTETALTNHLVFQ